MNSFNDMSSHQFSKHMNRLRTEVSVYLMIKNKNVLWDSERRELTWTEGKVVSSPQLRLLQHESTASLT